MRESRVKVCELLCETLRATDAFSNLRELRWNEEGEYVTPIFEDGAGEPNERFPKGYYAVNCRCDSGISVIMDVMKQFAWPHC